MAWIGTELGQWARETEATAKAKIASGEWTQEQANQWISRQAADRGYSASGPKGKDPYNVGGAVDETGDWQKRLLTEYNTRPWIGSQDVEAPQFMDMGQARGYTTGALEALRGAGQTGDQTRALAYLQGAAEGTAPSAAAIQQRQGLEDAMRAQLSMAARSRGGAQSLAMRQAGMNTAQLQQRGINDAAMLRAQEMAQARGQYAGAAANAAELEAQRRAQFAQAALANYQAEGGLDVHRASLMQQRAIANQRADLEAKQLGIQRDAAMRAQLGEGYQRVLANRMALAKGTTPPQTFMSGVGNIVSKGAQGGAMGGGWGALAGIFSGMAGNAIRDEETGRIK